MISKIISTFFFLIIVVNISYPKEYIEVWALPDCKYAMNTFLFLYESKQNTEDFEIILRFINPNEENPKIVDIENDEKIKECVRIKALELEYGLEIIYSYFQNKLSNNFVFLDWCNNNNIESDCINRRMYDPNSGIIESINDDFDYALFNDIGVSPAIYFNNQLILPNDSDLRHWISKNVLDKLKYKFLIICISDENLDYITGEYYRNELMRIFRYVPIEKANIHSKFGEDLIKEFNIDKIPAFIVNINDKEGNYDFLKYGAIGNNNNKGLYYLKYLNDHFHSNKERDLLKKGKYTFDITKEDIEILITRIYEAQFITIDIPNIISEDLKYLLLANNELAKEKYDYSKTIDYLIKSLYNNKWLYPSRSLLKYVIDKNENNKIDYMQVSYIVELLYEDQDYELIYKILSKNVINNEKLKLYYIISCLKTDSKDELPQLGPDFSFENLENNKMLNDLFVLFYEKGFRSNAYRLGRFLLRNDSLANEYLYSNVLYDLHSYKEYIDFVKDLDKKQTLDRKQIERMIWVTHAEKEYELCKHYSEKLQNSGGISDSLLNIIYGCVKGR